MQELDVFLSRLIPTVAGCPDLLARRSLVDAAIAFCEATHIIRLTSFPQPALAGIGAYEVDIPRDHKVCNTLRAWCGERELAPAAEDMIHRVQAHTRNANGAVPQQGTPTYFYESAPGEVSIYPLPAETLPNMLTFRVAVKPSRAATRLHDVLAEDWIEAIVFGARAKLHAIPGQYYTSAPIAAECAGHFARAISKAKSEALIGRTRAPLVVALRPFA
jgi:hypothetical protein